MLIATTPPGPLVNTGEPLFHELAWRPNTEPEDAVQLFFEPRPAASRAAAAASAAPVLHIGGDHDIVFPVENWYALNAQLPTLQLATFPSADHGPQHRYPRQAAALVGVHGGRPGLLAVKPVVGAGQGIDAGAVEVERATQVQRVVLVHQAGHQFAGAAFHFQPQAAGAGRGEVLRLRHPARHAGPFHRALGGDGAHEVGDAAVEQAHAPHAAAGQVLLERDVQARGQLGLERRVAHAVG